MPTDFPINQRVLISATTPATFKLVVVMILLGGTDLGNKQLAKNSGLSLPTVQASLLFLHDLGLVTKTGRYNGWTLTGGLAELCQKVGPGSQKVFDSLIRVDSYSLNTSLIGSESTIDLTSQNYFDSPEDVPEDKTDVLVTLHMMHIKDPKASTLAQLPHVTETYLEDYSKGVLYGTIDTALAIWKIERGQNWAFNIPRMCPGCYQGYEWGQNIFKLDHLPDCSVKTKALKWWGNQFKKEGEADE